MSSLAELHPDWRRSSITKVKAFALIYGLADTLSMFQYAVEDESAEEEAE